MIFLPWPHLQSCSYVAAASLFNYVFASSVQKTKLLPLVFVVKQADRLEHLEIKCGSGIQPRLLVLCYIWPRLY